MIQITSPAIENYLFQLASRYDEPVLQKMEALAHREDFPIIDRLVGSLAKLLAAAIGARRVFEMGSGFGYSAYWFSQAVGPEGRVHCTDGSDENRKRAQKFLSQAGLWSRIQYQVGDAIQLVKQTDGLFDVIFNDIDKGDYPDAWEVAKQKLRPGGLYMADNTLWFGRVAEQKVTDDEAPGWTEAIREHNRRVFSDPNFDSSLIPLRDGVLVARKRS